MQGVHGGYLLGEQPEPGRARWRKDGSQGLVKTAAPADERLSSPPPLNR